LNRVLQGVPRLGSVNDQFLSPIAALAAALQSEGLHTDYASLMCLGGGAFRACWSSEWLERCTVACSEDIVANAAATQGFTATTRMLRDEEEAWREIVSSVDSGLPLLTCGLADRSDWAVIIGYEEGPRMLLLNGRQNEPPDTHAEKFEAWMGWTYNGDGQMPLITLKRIGRVMDDIDAFRANLERAVRFDGEGEFEIRDVTGRATRFHSGARAYMVWADDVLKMAAGWGIEKHVERARLISLNTAAIIDARRAAIADMERFKRRGTRQIYDLTVAADRYAREILALQEAAALAPDASKLKECSAAIRHAGEEEGKAVAALSRVLRQLPSPK